MPANLRHALKIDEGSILEVKMSAEGILLKPVPPIESGKVVGEESYRQIIDELDGLRKKWR